MFNRILIGSSPSTGSSLLCRILNQHSKLLCGPETHLFTHRSLYTEWLSIRDGFTTNNIPHDQNELWSMDYRINLDSSFYLLNQDQLEKILSASESFQEFADAVFKWPLQHFGATSWIEKTPANACTFRYFLKTFGNSAVIHIYRNPLDTMASLCARGLNPYYAVGLYLIHNAHGIENWGQPNCLQISYEQLVEQTDFTLYELCNLIGCEYETKLMKADTDPEGDSRMKGWKYDESAEIATGSIGRFEEMQGGIQRIIKACINQLGINPRYAETNEIQHKQIYSLANAMGYFDIEERLQRVKGEASIPLRYFKFKHRLLRLKRGEEGVFTSKHPLSWI